MGSFVSRPPTYMFQSPSGYIFRLRIPKDLKEIVGKCELRYSLKAGALRVAKQRARFIASFIQQLFMKVRNNMSEYTTEKITELVKGHIRKVTGRKEACDDMVAEVTPGSIISNGKTVSEPSYMTECNGVSLLDTEAINQLVIQYIRETLRNDEKCRAMAGTVVTGSITLEGMSLLESSNMKADEARSLLHSVTRWLQLADHSLMHPITEKILKANSVEVIPASETYKTLSRELMKAFQSVLHVRIKRSEGDYTITDEDLVPMLKASPVAIQQTQQPILSQATEPKKTPAVKFTEVQEKYLVEVEISESWTEKTKAENMSIFALFIRVMGDLDIQEIDRQLMSKYKGVLMQLPPNLNKSRKYKDLKIEDIIASKPEKTLTVNTINKYLRRLSGLLNFAVRNGFIQSNPAEGMQIKKQKRADKEREAYTLDDLNLLFKSTEYTEGSHRQSYGFWTPLIALYSGCRLEEICQLHLDDIREEGGVWVFDINDKAEKRVKTMSSERLVPVHPDLIDVGLIKHVEQLRREGADRLFPELRSRRDGYGQTVSKWFQRYKARCGIGKGKTFHSFRHTFITHLKHKHVEPFMIHELDGHAVDSQTMGRYGKRYTPEILLGEAIKKIDYGLDLDQLKQ